MVCRYFLLFCRLPFHSVDCFLCCTERHVLLNIHLSFFWRTEQIYYYSVMLDVNGIWRLFSVQGFEQPWVTLSWRVSTRTGLLGRARADLRLENLGLIRRGLAFTISSETGSCQECGESDQPEGNGHTSEEGCHVAGES